MTLPPRKDRARRQRSDTQKRAFSDSDSDSDVRPLDSRIEKYVSAVIHYPLYGVLL